jgi:dienelactone hydrolase
MDGRKPAVVRRAARFARVRAARAFRRDTRIWRAASVGIAVVWTALAAVCALGIPTGLGYGFDAALLIPAALAGLGIGGTALAYLFSLLRLPIPRLFAGVYATSTAGITIALHDTDMGWAGPVVAAVITGIGAAAGGLVQALAGLWRNPVRTFLALLAAAVAAGVLTAGSPLVPDEASAVLTADDRVFDAEEAAEDVPPDLLSAGPGPYGYTSFTYGSGTDRHRTEFGEAADVVTRTADATAIHPKWSPIRTRFWGFGTNKLPLNGRVWMPEGDGAFPLVLIVHGNHLMEDFSDEGYAYLGERLASRGIIAVSVDENFLNYSVWSGIPKPDMKLRSWLLLRHLNEIAELSRTPGNPFHARVDLERIGLVGHSRGGQAAAMAADHERWFADDPSLAAIGKEIRIAAVAAIAPTDMLVDGKRAELRGVSYLTIHGSRDADLQNFYGDQQYVRTALDGRADLFKAEIYLEGANHGQFNTTWGRFDLSMPAGMLLNTRDLMEGEAQREAAAGYIAAFLEAALNGKEAYRRFFSDPDLRQSLAGKAAVYGRYEAGDYAPVSRFEVSDVRLLKPGVTAEAEGMTEWTHAAALNRDGKSRGYKGLVLAWDGDARYTIAFGESYWRENDLTRASAVAFSLADLSHELRESGAYAVEIGLEGANGLKARLPLDRFGILKSPPRVTFTIHRFLERRFGNGKYKADVEPVFETFIVPLAAFEKERPGILADGIRSVTLHVAGGPGKLMMDEFGFYPDGP